MLADLHTHSRFSFDGAAHATIESMAEAALSAGLSHLAITDHCDINGELEGRDRIPDRDEQFAEVQAAKEKYRGRLEILFGIELGQAHHHPAEALAILEKHPYDIVLGSVHNLRGEADFYWMDMDKLDDEQAHKLFDRVIEETLEVCDFPQVRIITHLSYMERYMFRVGKRLDYTPHKEGLRRLFGKIIDKDLVLELNSSDLAGGYALPPAELLTLYRACGGTKVSLGSDAHQPEQIGRSFAAAKQLLLDCGFTHLTIPCTTGDITYPIETEVSA